MEVAVLFVEPVVSLILQKLAALAESSYARRQGIVSELKKLENLLPLIQAVLADAEEKQMTSKAVKLWMEDLNDLAYHLDDLLDQLNTEAQLQLIKQQSQASSSTSKVRKLLLPPCCKGFTLPSAVKLNENLMSKVEEITAKLTNIETQKKILNLQVIVGETMSNKAGERPETSSLVEKNVFGREEDTKAIIEELLQGETSDNKVSVIPIVGMGGIGKTTLAQLVYSDERLKDRFDHKAWVCVSGDFDVTGVTKKILEAVTSKRPDLEALDKLQEQLMKALSGKRFLLVLDDVWNENYKKWGDLCLPFLHGPPETKIIVTTRLENVAKIASTMAPSLAYPLKLLSEKECLSIFAQHALGRPNFDAHPDLKEIGMKIVNKCDGLALAAKTLGGLLRNESRRIEWENILNSKIWNLSKQESDILPALSLSYRHLPSHLKQCFAYCAIFPKDYEFDKDELVLLWMGVGLLPLSKEKRMEDFGDEYFNDLLSRSFFQRSGGGKSQFVMHDSLNELAVYVAGNIFSRQDKLEGEKPFEIPKRARHFSYIRQRFEILQKFKPLCEVQHLRTLLALPVQTFDWKNCRLAKNILFDLLPKLQCLRVLSLSGYAITELPDSIRDLKHIRYLNLSWTSIKQLGESVSNLCNLQTLSLRGCKELSMLPPNIENLINLRHFDIADTVQLREMCSGIGTLTNLQTLSKFVVGKNHQPRLTELTDLSCLHGMLSIIQLQKVTDPQDANEANLKDKQDLEELGLAWSSDSDDSRDETLEMRVLDKLQPHINLKRLTIEFYRGTHFPRWIGDSAFSKMVNVTLVGCRKCISLPALGQLPMLKELCIRDMHGVQNLGVEFYGAASPLGPPFSSLEKLIFEDMPKWKEWSCSTGGQEAERQFCCLRELTICGCPELNRVSLLRLPSLEKLYLANCPDAVLKSMVELTSLTSMEVKNISGLSYLEEALVQSLGALESLQFRECNQLKALWQNSRRAMPKNNLLHLRRLDVVLCPQLVSFGEELDDEGLPCINLRSLLIINGVNLEKLPNELNNLKYLTDLRISGCPKLTQFPEKGVPRMLKYLEIFDCNALKSLPNGGVENLRIYTCSSLRSWPANTLSTSLKKLSISNCMNLEYFWKVSESTMMPQQQQQQEVENFNNINIDISSLEGLEIYNWAKVGMLLQCANNNSFASLTVLLILKCDDMESLSFPEGGLPNLRKLLVSVCKNLRSLALTNLNLQSLNSLYIGKCYSLESLSFPERGGCSLSTPNLRLLQMIECSILKSLPFFDQILPSFASLESLVIFDCPYLDQCFFSPQGNWNLPPNLVTLRIGKCGEILKPLSEWGLHRLTSLQEFRIEGGCPDLISFPLPKSLTKLRIARLPNLESISYEALQNLTSLRHLYLRNCFKLRSLPKEGLPSTLQSLEIGNCPRLEQRCLEDRGDYWPKIAHIPHVQLGRIHDIEWNMFMLN